MFRHLGPHGGKFPHLLTAGRDPLGSNLGQVVLAVGTGCGPMLPSVVDAVRGNQSAMVAGMAFLPPARTPLAGTRRTLRGTRWIGRGRLRRVARVALQAGAQVRILLLQEADLFLQEGQVRLDLRRQCIQAGSRNTRIAHGVIVFQGGSGSKDVPAESGQGND